MATTVLNSSYVSLLRPVRWAIGLWLIGLTGAWLTAFGAVGVIRDALPQIDRPLFRLIVLAGVFLIYAEFWGLFVVRTATFLLLLRRNVVWAHAAKVLVLSFAPLGFVLMLMMLAGSWIVSYVYRLSISTAVCLAMGAAIGTGFYYGHALIAAVVRNYLNDTNLRENVQPTPSPQQRRAIASSSSAWRELGAMVASLVYMFLVALSVYYVLMLFTHGLSVAGLAAAAVIALVYGGALVALAAVFYDKGALYRILFTTRDAKAKRNLLEDYLGFTVLQASVIYSVALGSALVVLF